MARVIINPEQNNLFKDKLKGISNLDSKILNKIKIADVIVDVEEKLCIIQLRIPDNKTVKESINKLTKNISLQHGKIKFKFNYYDNNLALTEILAQDWTKIAKLSQKQFPQTNGWLSNCRYQIKGDKIELEVDSQMAVEALQNKGCDKFLKRLLLQRYGKKAKIEFKVGDFSQQRNKTRNEKEKENKEYMDNLVKSLAQQERNSTKQIKNSDILLGKKINQAGITVAEISEESKQAIVKGEVFAEESRKLSNGNYLIIFAITDQKNSINVKTFVDSNDPLVNSLNKGMHLKVKGKIEYDRYDKEFVIMAKDINVIEQVKKKDNYDEKRVELHLHTKMSAMDSIVNVKKAVKLADEWGHSAIAVTDHGVVQAFPDAYNAAKDRDIKLIYGLEAYLIDDGEPIILNPLEKKIAQETFVIFDLETTGLNPHKNEIIEVGAVKVKAGEIIDKFQTFVNPEVSIPTEITKLTGITDQDVADAPKIEQVLKQFKDFIAQSTIVAHNLSFDLGFIEDKLRRFNQAQLNNPALDTLNLARGLLPGLKSYKLNKLAKRFKVNLDNHHRAIDDAKATSKIFIKLLELLDKEEITKLNQINNLISKIDHKRLYPYHTTILVKNQTGLKNLYKLVSKAHINNFHRVPRVLKSELMELREGLIIGSACEAGKLYKAILQGKTDNELLEIAKFYDYLEVQPLGNNEFLLAKGEVDSWQELEEINKKIYQLGQKAGIPVIAAGDVHFLNPEDAVYRQILKEGQGFDDADQQPPLYYRTTTEMLDEFSYFEEQVAKELVIDNPNQIAAEIDELKPMPDGLYTPEIEGADKEIREMAYQKAKNLYGDPIPELVEKRLERELKSIIDNGFAVIYLISQKLVKKSLDDGYLVGSRGSVGSSLAAMMTDITEVNPLPPHYRCPKCCYSKFFTDGSIGSGPDLEDKSCPECGSELDKDGFDIPFEVFLGFEGDKVPDIDLNFSGEYQPEVHKYTEKLFGEDYVYRAGTISTIADRTAYGFVKGHMEENTLNLRKTEVNRLSKGIIGVKRTTGQHPGGQMVIPEDMEVYDFTPIQRPANDMDSDVLTTHFDYHSISGRILKLDILGHDDPTSIRMLQDETGVDPIDIPLDDPKTIGIFSSIEPLGISKEDQKELGVELGTLGIPEFGTSFVRGMLKETRPDTFAELVRISGLSHGADVWLNNAQDLIQANQASLSEVISVRDDIMNYLLQKGVEPSQAFWIMEHVRKGKGLTEEEEAAMRENGVPDWYVKSCKKINYMFPKAHAAAYVMMAFRIAYFKVHHPTAFYNTYFTIKANDFDAQIVLQGKEKIKEILKEINQKGNDATAKDKSTARVLKIVLEAMLRGIEFVTVDIYNSKAKEFVITDEGLLPPLISIDGLGASAADSLVEARKDGEFTSIEDLSNRASLTKTVIEVMKEHGSLDGLPETDQLSLFG